MTFIPNERAVAEAAENLIKRAKGGGKPTLEDARWWANAHAYSNEPGSNSEKFWLAVRDYLAANH